LYGGVILTTDNSNPPNEIPERVKINPEAVIEGLRSTIEENSLLLPDFLDISLIPDPNLYSIYKESYFCILCGSYNAGIILLGQLMEVALKEVIFLNTGELKKGTFGKALDFADKNRIIFDEDFRFLLQFKNRIRDPYTHRDFRKILGYHFMPVWQFPTGKTPQEMLKNIQTMQEGIKSGKYPPQFIDSASSSVTGTIAKEQIDKSTAIHWAWMVYSELEQISAIYLTQAAYDEYQRKFGSPFEVIAKIKLEEEDVEDT
jgi:hypothetical protein